MSDALEKLGPKLLNDSCSSVFPRVCGQGYNVLFWSHNGMYFCAASDLNSIELRQFAQLLER